MAQRYGGQTGGGFAQSQRGGLFGYALCYCFILHVKRVGNKQCDSCVNILTCLPSLLHIDLICRTGEVHVVHSLLVEGPKTTPEASKPTINKKQMRRKLL